MVYYHDLHLWYILDVFVTSTYWPFFSIITLINNTIFVWYSWQLFLKFSLYNGVVCMGIGVKFRLIFITPLIWAVAILLLTLMGGFFNDVQVINKIFTITWFYNITLMMIVYVWPNIDSKYKAVARLYCSIQPSIFYHIVLVCEKWACVMSTMILICLSVVVTSCFMSS